MQNNEIVSSVKSILKERALSAMWGTFILSWCAWNWEAIYITLFVDQDLILQITKNLKIDYLLNQYEWSTLAHIIWSSLKLIIGPLVTTYLIIWWVAKLDFICFKKYNLDKFHKKEELLRIENKLLKEDRFYTKNLTKSLVFV